MASRKRRLLRWALTYTAAMWMLAPHPASARPSAPPSEGEARATARAFADKGLRLYKEGRYEEAVEAFIEAERHFHAPTVLIYRARAYEKLGLLLQAQSSYQEILNREYPETAPKAFRAAYEEAKGEIEALTPRIPTLEIVLRGATADQVQVVVDKYPVRGSSLKRPIRLNPGSHTVVVSAPHRAPDQRTVVLKEQDRQVMVFELPSPRPTPAPVGPRSERTAAPRDAPRDAGDAGGSLVPAAIAFTAGVAGLGIGITAGALALGKKNDLDELCPDRQCGGGSEQDFGSASSLHGSAVTLGTMSTVGFIVGGVATATGVVLVIVRPGGTTRAQVGLRTGPGRVAFQGRF
jgi:hypothetical protein